MEKKNILNKENISLLKLYYEQFSRLDIWKRTEIEEDIKAYCKNNDINLGKLAQPLRAAVTGQQFSPSIFTILEILGKETTLKRLKKSFSNY